MWQYKIKIIEFKNKTSNVGLKLYKHKKLFHQKMFAKQYDVVMTYHELNMIHIIKLSSGYKQR